MIKAKYIILITFFVFPLFAFAQSSELYEEDDEEYEEDEEEEVAPAPAPAPVNKSLSKPVVSIAQALGSTSLSKGCVEDFSNVLGKSGFSMTSFAKELVPAVAKTKLKLKLPFGKPKDDDMAGAGLTVGCIKTLPESPAEIQSLLKDIALKAGLNFAESSISTNTIPTNIDTEEEEEGGIFKTAIPIGLMAGGLGTLIYGIVQNNEVVDSVNKRDGKAAIDARSSRNISYGIGLCLLAGGLTVYIVF
jgi:hypothetical protein